MVFRRPKERRAVLEREHFTEDGRVLFDAIHHHRKGFWVNAFNAMGSGLLTALSLHEYASLPKDRVVTEGAAYPSGYEGPKSGYTVEDRPVDQVAGCFTGGGIFLGAGGLAVFGSLATMHHEHMKDIVKKVEKGDIEGAIRKAEAHPQLPIRSSRWIINLIKGLKEARKEEDEKEPIIIAPEPAKKAAIEKDLRKIFNKKGLEALSENGIDVSKPFFFRPKGTKTMRDQSIHVTQG